MQSRMKAVLFVALATMAVLAVTAGVAQATLISYWALDEAAGATAAGDTSGYNTNHLTSYTLGTGATTPTAGSTGVIGNAWQFYGTTTTASGLRNTAVSTNMAGMTATSFGCWIWESASAPTTLNPVVMRAKLAANALPGNSTDVYTLNIYNPAGSTSKPYPIGMMIDGGGLSSGGDRNVGSGAGDYNTYPERYATPGAWTFMMATWYSTGTGGTNNYGTGKAYLYRNGILVGSNENYTCGVMRAASETNACGFYMSGVTTSTNVSVTGLLDDAGVWDESLSSEKVKALYTAPTTFTTDAAAGFYGQKDMQSLFNLYSNDAHTPVAINGKTWRYMATSSGHSPGDSWIFGGDYFIQLGSGDDGSGVSTYVPEPSTLLLLASGLLGLLAYAWRKRK